MKSAFNNEDDLKYEDDLENDKTWDMEIFQIVKN